MAKVVSTKFGDRRLVYLPPINLTGIRTANVETIEPARTSPRRYRYGDDGGAHSKQSQIVPKEYAYRERGRRREQRQPWLGSPTNANGEGNLVTENGENVGDVIFNHLYQQARTNSLSNYSKGQYPVLPPVSGDPHFMQYTNQGLTNITQKQEPPVPVQQCQPPPPGGSNLQQPGSNPHEKHIYYGPDGEVLSSSPSCQLPSCQRPIVQDFAFEGLLRNGRLVSVNIVESQRGFPKIPDILLRDLLEKYGQFEETIIRVVARRGQFYVHAIPNMPDLSPRGASFRQSALTPEYVPVYLEEGEDFDYNKFIQDYQSGNYQKRDYAGRNPYQNPPLPQRRYRTPPLLDRNNEIPSRDRRLYSPDIRPSEYDPVSHLRWQKNDRRWTSDTRRIINARRQTMEDGRRRQTMEDGRRRRTMEDGLRTASESGHFTFKTLRNRRAVYTQEALPVESLRHRR